MYVNYWLSKMSSMFCKKYRQFKMKNAIDHLWSAPLSIMAMLQFLRNCEIEKWNSRVMIGPFHNSDIWGKNGTQTIPRCFYAICSFLVLMTKSIVFAQKQLYKFIMSSILWSSTLKLSLMTALRIIYMGNMLHLTTCAILIHWSLQL